MSDSPIRFEMGDEFHVNKDNADEWVSVLGRPLADAIKSMPSAGPKKFVIICVDHDKGVITFAPLSEEIG